MNTKNDTPATYMIEPCSGIGIDDKAMQTVTVIDVEGGQVADFFAERAGCPGEFLSTAVTIDCNESLRIGEGGTLYTNLYRPMFRVLVDEVGTHDLLFPCCRRETYDFFFHNGEGHPNCFDNINRSLGGQRHIIQPVNLFMHTTIDVRGKSPSIRHARGQATKSSCKPSWTCAWASPRAACPRGNATRGGARR